MLIQNQRINEIINLQKNLMISRDNNVISLRAFGTDYNRLEQEKKQILYSEIAIEKIRLEKESKEMAEKKLRWKEELRLKAEEEFKLLQAQRDKDNGEDSMGIDKVKKQQRSDVKMADANAKPVDKPKKEKVVKAKVVTQADLIAQALELKGVKSYDAVAEKVLAQLPGADKVKVIRQTKVIIGLVKKQEKRWSGYTWDEANFLLVKKA